MDIVNRIYQLAHKLDSFGIEEGWLIHQEVEHLQKEYVELVAKDDTQQAEIQRLQSIIKEMQQVDDVLAPQKWISVDDRLPDCDEFLGANFRGNAWIAFCWKFKVNNHNGDFYKYTGGKTVHKNNITHWQPLPPKP